MADQPTRSTVIPGMHYRNAPDAIEWLCRVFGFEKHAVYAGPGNIIMHAELTLGGGMIMLGSANDNAPHRNMKLPSELDGAQTRSISLIVKDADEVYTRATAAGAKIVETIEEALRRARLCLPRSRRSSLACRDVRSLVGRNAMKQIWPIIAVKNVAESAAHPRISAMLNR